jgi:hypothetical protein
MDDRAATKLWVEHWQRVGPLLERVRHDELRSMTDEQAAQAFESLTDLAVELPDRTPRLTSGFIEQQRLFQKQLIHGSPN